MCVALTIHGQRAAIADSTGSVLAVWYGGHSDTRRDGFDEMIRDW
jgi:hypothetical protein